MSDPAIEQLESELRESRFSVWDAETFLANRHQAKIEALTNPEKNEWQRRWCVVQELTTIVCALVGYATILTIAGLWLVTGEFPL